MSFSNKNKTKFISLFSAIVLWLYVITTVDPSETKKFKDIPITISNAHLLNENNLSLFPEENLTASITIKTNLSKLKKITKDNIVISGSLSNPVPGKNILTLTSNLPDSVRVEIAPSTVAVNLETIETFSHEISVIANKKYNTDDYEIKIEKESIELSGTKTIANKVDKVIAKLKGNNNDSDFSEKLELIPIDKDGNKVENLKLSDKYITAHITKIIKEEELLLDESLNEEKLEGNTTETDKTDESK